MDTTTEQGQGLVARETATAIGHRSRQAAVAELGQAALCDATPEVVLDMALRLLREVLRVEYAKVLQCQGPSNSLLLVAGLGWRDEVEVGKTTVPADDHSQAGYTLRSTAPVVVDDLRQETRFAGPQLLTDHGVVSGMSVVIQGSQRPFGVLGVHTTRHRHFSAEDVDFVRLIANVVGSAIQHAGVVEQLEARARYETALAECAQELLASTGDERVKHALEALLAATNATYVFLERNVLDAALGFCSQTVAEVEQAGSRDAEARSDYWDLVPWHQMPISRRNLEQGKPLVIVPDKLEGPEHDLYMSDPYPIRTELDIPIFVDGEWSGLIGFADKTEVREWTDTDVSLLTTAAKMFGSFWEREAARKRLRDANLAKDAFLASVSHELRTPLTAMVGFAEVLRDDTPLLSQERAEFLETMVAQGRDLTGLVDDLLTGARANLGVLSVELESVDLRMQTAAVISEFPETQIASVDLGLRLPVIGDPDRIRQIVRNLITNAVRYGGDKIRVVLMDDAATGRLLVCDDGPAIPEDDRERIFEAYQRAHDVSGLAGSVGLGLSISRQLAQLMGGELAYRYEAGESIFELALRKESGRH